MSINNQTGSVSTLAADYSRGLRSLLVVLCLLWPMILVAADAADYLRDARAYIGKGEYSAAVIQLKNVLLIEPGNAEARLLLGNVYLEQKDGLSAEKELSRALDLGVPRETVLTPLGRAWLMTGQYDKVLQGLVQESGDSSELALNIQLLQGQAYLATGTLAMAEEKFTRVLEFSRTPSRRCLAELALPKGVRIMLRPAALLTRHCRCTPIVLKPGI